MNPHHHRTITWVCALSALVLGTLIAVWMSRTPPPPPAPRPAAVPAPPPTPPPVPVAMPFNEAVLKAAHDLFSKMPPPAAERGVAGKRVVVIDPLVDGVTGVQSNVTASIEARIVELVRTS